MTIRLVPDLESCGEWNGQFCKHGGFPKLWVPFWGVPIVRIIVYWGLYWGIGVPLFWGTVTLHSTATLSTAFRSKGPLHLLARAPCHTAESRPCNDALSHRPDQEIQDQCPNLAHCLVVSMLSGKHIRYLRRPEVEKLRLSWPEPRSAEGAGLLRFGQS